MHDAQIPDEMALGEEEEETSGSGDIESDEDQDDAAPDTAPVGVELGVVDVVTATAVLGLPTCVTLGVLVVEALALCVAVADTVDVRVSVALPDALGVAL